jgi:uncharacterized RmlC-like cupin family protein
MMTSHGNRNWRFSPSVHIVKPLQLADNGPQTQGMLRLEAHAQSKVAFRNLHAHVLLLAPGAESAVHHHGRLETIVYVAEGQGKIRWGFRLEHEAYLDAGDFFFIPPFLPHQESNRSALHDAQWIVLQNSPKTVVVNLALQPNGEYAVIS